MTAVVVETQDLVLTSGERETQVEAQDLTLPTPDGAAAQLVLRSVELWVRRFTCAASLLQLEIPADLWSIAGYYAVELGMRTGALALFFFCALLLRFAFFDRVSSLSAQRVPLMRHGAATSCGSLKGARLYLSIALSGIGPPFLVRSHYVS